MIERGYQFLSDSRMDGIAATLEAIRDGLADVGLPPRSIENEWGPGQIEITFSPMEGLAAADAMVLFRSTVKAVCARLGLHAIVHVLAGAAQLLPQRLAPAPVAGRGRERPQRLRGRPRAPVANGPPVRRRAARACARDGRVRRPDHERLRALPPVLVRPRPDLLGRRQPRRADPRPGRPGRRRHARREPALRAGREPVPVARREHRRRPGRHRPRRRAAGARRRRPLRGGRAPAATVARRGRSTTSSAAGSTGRRSATRSSTTS